MTECLVSMNDVTGFTQRKSGPPLPISVRPVMALTGIDIDGGQIGHARNLGPAVRVAPDRARHQPKMATRRNPREQLAAITIARSVIASSAPGFVSGLGGCLRRMLCRRRLPT